MRSVMVLLAAATVAFVHVDTAKACSKAHESPFSLYERASVVAEVQVMRTPVPTTRRRGGPVTLRVRQVLKGRAGKLITSLESGTSCSVGFRRGRRALVFLDTRRRVLGHYEGYIELTAATRTWRPLLRSFGVATSAAGKAAILVDVIVAGKEPFAHEAAYHLMGAPALLRAVSASERARLLAALPRAKQRSPLPVVLARLRVPGLVKELARRQLTYGRVARRFLSRPALDKIRKRRVLAAIVSGRGGGGWKAPDRIVAFERCEMLVGTSLAPYGTMYFGGVARHYWRVLAKACRTGRPAHW